MHKLVVAAAVLIITLIVWIIFKNMKKLEMLVTGSVSKSPSVQQQSEDYANPRKTNTQLSKDRVFRVFATFDLQMVPGETYRMIDYVNKVKEVILTMASNDNTDTKATISKTLAGTVDKMMADYGLTLDIIVEPATQKQGGTSPSKEFDVQTCTKLSSSGNKASCAPCGNKNTKSTIIDPTKKESTCVNAPGQSFKTHAAPDKIKKTVNITFDELDHNYVPNDKSMITAKEVNAFDPKKPDPTFVKRLADNSDSQYPVFFNIVEKYNQPQFVKLFMWWNSEITQATMKMRDLVPTKEKISFGFFSDVQGFNVFVENFSNPADNPPKTVSLQSEWTSFLRARPPSLPSSSSLTDQPPHVTGKIVDDGTGSSKATTFKLVGTQQETK